MKDGTNPFDFPPRNERSRTDVPHGTGEIPHGPDRRAMADPSKTSAATFAPRGAPDDLPSRHPRRDHLCCPQWLPLAASASEFANWNTVYGIFFRWRNDGTWQRTHDTRRDMLRCRLGRKKSPSAAIIDSQ